MDVLSLLADEADAHIADVETWSAGSAGNGNTEGLVGLATLREGGMFEADDDHLVIGTAGHVDHGKSTLVGTLVTGRADDGQGGTRGFLDVQPHEIERGLSADLSYAVYGFDDDGDEPIRMDNPHRKSDRAQRSSRRPIDWSRLSTRLATSRGSERRSAGSSARSSTTGSLVVAADDGPTKTTREHLGILLATELPTIVAITKTDAVSDERLTEVEREVESTLRDAGQTPLVDRHGIDTAVAEVGDGVVPLLRTSAVTKEGIGTLDRLFETLPKRATRSARRSGCTSTGATRTGVGAVASGTVNSGTVEAGDELLLGRWPTAPSARWRRARSRCTTTESTKRPPAGSSGSR